MKSRSWKFWAVMAIITGGVLFVTANAIAFFMAIIFLDEPPCLIVKQDGEDICVTVSELPKPHTPAQPKSQTIDDIDFSQYSTELADYTDLSLGQSRIAAIDVVRLLFAPDGGEKIIKTSTKEFEIDGGALMLLSASELVDDSVRAQEFYLIFEGTPTAQKLAGYGLRVKCYRGENAGQWQKEACL